MKDILGREIPEGSLVIGMIVSRDSDGMRFGVFRDNQCVWRKYGLMKSKPRNVYLVENPSQQELKIKQEILEELNKKELEEKQKKDERKLLKRIPTKQLVIGEIYKDDKGGKWVYFGLSSVKTTVTDGYGRHVKEPEIKHGYCYLPQWRSIDLSHVSVLKNPKKLVEKLEITDNTQRVDLSNLVCTKKVNWHNDNKCTTEIILEDSHD